MNKNKEVDFESRLKEILNNRVICWNKQALFDEILKEVDKEKKKAWKLGFLDGQNMYKDSMKNIQG